MWETTSETEDPHPVVRIEFLGGKWDGMVLLPIIGWMDGIDRNWSPEIEDVPEVDAPIKWHIINDYTICVHGHDWGGMYEWFWGDKWVFVDGGPIVH